MAVNIVVYDLLNYPDNAKTLTVDIKSVVPTGAGGDEKWVVSCDTTSTASGSAAIQETFVDGTLVGWAKSSTRVSDPFTISSSNLNMKVAIDEPVGSATPIVLVVDASPVSGNSVATDIEAQIRAATVTGGDKAGNMSYLNASVYYVDGRFVITSGSVSNTFTGSGRTSVRVDSGDTNDVAVTLGFDIPLESEELAATAVTETFVTAVVSASTTVPVNSVTGITAGDCVAFKETTGTITYRYVDSVSAPNIVVNTAVDLEDNAMIQVMRMQDIDAPASYYVDIDGAVRHAIEKLARQINYAS